MLRAESSAAASKAVALALIDLLPALQAALSREPAVDSPERYCFAQAELAWCLASEQKVAVLKVAGLMPADYSAGPALAK